MRKILEHFFKKLLALEDTPERIARAFALGVFLAFSPLVGLQTLLGVGLVFFCGLNRFALLLGIFINNPLTLVPIYFAGTYIGGLLIGFPRISAHPSFEVRLLWSGDFWGQLAGQWHILGPTIVGSFALSVFLSAFSYIAALALIRQRRMHQVKP
jgi:uncharacterized protein (DUF2062 family)